MATKQPLQMEKLQTMYPHVLAIKMRSLSAFVYLNLFLTAWQVHFQQFGLKIP